MYQYAKNRQSSDTKSIGDIIADMLRSAKPLGIGFRAFMTSKYAKKGVAI